MREVIHAHLGTRQVARVIYGAIIGLALVVVLEAHPPSAGVVVGSLLASALAVALAEGYSEIVATETRTRTRLSRHHAAEILDDVVAVFFGVSFPAIFFILAAAGLIGLGTAFTVAKWSGLALIGFYGWAAARLAGASAIVCALQAIAAALIGALLIGLKALIH
jgi:VIT1/CCC1 family predicted Fe2+/Mn2+ transporter